LFVVGVDIGSLATKAVLLSGKKEMAGYVVISTGSDSNRAGQTAIDRLIGDAGMHREQVAYILSTGYGRENISISNGQLTEITCHARGAAHIDHGVRTVIDIGGQDSKAISLNDFGDVVKFAMNDKCAAGTGRFLEVMAHALEIDLKDMGKLSLKSTRQVEVSSMCTVFAETEVVSLISRSIDRVDIIAAIHRAIARRTGNMIENIGVKPVVMMTGGVAKNIGVVRALEERLDCRILVPPEPQIVGALGAAIFALDRAASSDVESDTG
jgi:predicted CoA-substrate-specific enzyme activase